MARILKNWTLYVSILAVDMFVFPSFIIYFQQMILRLDYPRILRTGEVYSVINLAVFVIAIAGLIYKIIAGFARTRKDGKINPLDSALIRSLFELSIMLFVFCVTLLVSFALRGEGLPYAATVGVIFWCGLLGFSGVLTITSILCIVKVFRALFKRKTGM